MSRTTLLRTVMTLAFIGVFTLVHAEIDVSTLKNGFEDFGSAITTLWDPIRTTVVAVAGAYAFVSVFRNYHAIMNKDQEAIDKVSMTVFAMIFIITMVYVVPIVYTALAGE